MELVPKPKSFKRPSSSFIIYLSEKREKVVKEQPTLAFREVPKVIAEMFKSLSQEERKHYDNLSKLEKERHNREMEEDKKYKSENYVSNEVLPRSNGTNLLLPVVTILLLYHLYEYI